MRSRASWERVRDWQANLRDEKDRARFSRVRAILQFRSIAVHWSRKARVAMKEEATFTFNMAPIRVWTHLANLGAYAFWHPSYRFEGGAEPGKTVKLTYATFKGEYRIRAAATITAFDKSHRIAWNVRVGGATVFSEAYELKAVGAGTEIRHIIAFESLMGKVVGRLFRRIFRRSVHAQDFAFLSYLKKEMRGATAGINRR